jgi:hypothetical protein
MWNFKTLKIQNMYNWKFQNLNIVLSRIYGYNVHDVLNKILIYITLNSTFKY